MTKNPSTSRRLGPSVKGKGPRLAVILLLVALPLAGCTGGAEPQDALEGATIVTPTPATPAPDDAETVAPTPPPALRIDATCDHRRCAFAAQPAASGTFTSFQWDFGDGNRTAGLSVAHVFAATGPHRVVLSAKDAAGTVHAVEATVHVERAADDERPVARATWSCDHLQCSFDAMRSFDLEAPLASHRWDFGDGWTLDHAKVGHEYARAGTYRVTLTVTDAAGLTDTLTLLVPVSRAPPPAPGPQEPAPEQTPPTQEGGAPPAPPARPPPATPRPPARTLPPSEPATGEGGAEGGALPCGAPAYDRDARSFERLSFTWEHRGRNWTWDPLVPDDWWARYADRPRPTRWQDFDVLAADPFDDALLGQFACFADAASQEQGFSAYERIEFAVRFVQSLRYHTDAAGAGFDEYPKFPVETLVDQEGDCEDTSALLAALLEAMGHDAVLLVFEQVNDAPHVGHAAVGVAADGLPGAYWQHQGRRYHYVETTHSYDGIGRLPDVVQGQRAHVLPVAARAILGEPWWYTPAWEDGAYRIEVELTNLGTAPAENLTLWAGWDAGAGRAWAGETWHEPAALAGGDSTLVTLWLQPPPEGQRTRIWLMAWGSNAGTVEVFSEWFES